MRCVVLSGSVFSGAFRRAARFAVFGGVAVLLAANDASAVQIMTSPGPLMADTDREISLISITPDGTTLVATTNLDVSGQAATDQRTVGIPIPSDPTTEVATVTQWTTTDFFAGAYDVDFPPVVSPDGSTVLVTHDGFNGVNTIMTVPVGGEGASPFTGLFGGTPNLVSPGTTNRQPQYSPDGSTIFFINGNAGFQGAAIPDFEAGDDPPRAFFDAPEWDQIYAVPAAGGTPIAVTSPGDGDIDNNLFAVAPDGASVVYAPTEAVTTRTQKGASLGKLYSVSAAGGASTEIPMTASSTNPHFAIEDRIDVSPDGQSVFFIGDYETLGKYELFSVPVAGGTPTRVSDDLPFGGDVYGFEFSPDGTSIAYHAGQNASGNSELFLKTIGGAAGSSIRISDAPAANDGTHDIEQAGKGGYVFAPDGTKVYAVGDLITDALNDIWEFDLTEKTGLTPSVYTYVGPADGEFFDENNWQDADGNPAPADTINPDAGITHALLIDGDSVTTSEAGQLDLALGASLELTAGSSLTLTQTGQQFDLNPGTSLKMTDATITVDDDYFFDGDVILNGGSMISLNDDIEFSDQHTAIIDGTTFEAGDNIIFDNDRAIISNATFSPADRLGLSFESQVVLTDTVIDIQGGFGDVDEVFHNENGEGSTLILQGASVLYATSIDDGIDLVLDDQSIAEFNGDNIVDESELSTITLLTTDAEIVINNAADTFDARPFLIDGRTGLSYADDPTAWTVTDWDGFVALESLMLASDTPMLVGDADGDGDVDGDDLIAVQTSFGDVGDTPLLGDADFDGDVDGDDLIAVQTNFGETAGAVATPEPTAVGLLGVALSFLGGRAARRRR